MKSSGHQGASFNAFHGITTALGFPQPRYMHSNLILPLTLTKDGSSNTWREFISNPENLSSFESWHSLQKNTGYVSVTSHQWLKYPLFHSLADSLLGNIVGAKDKIWLLCGKWCEDKRELFSLWKSEEKKKKQRICTLNGVTAGSCFLDHITSGNSSHCWPQPPGHPELTWGFTR